MLLQSCILGPELATDHLFMQKDLLTTSYVPGIVLGAGDTKITVLFIFEVLALSTMAGNGKNAQI